MMSVGWFLWLAYRMDSSSGETISLANTGNMKDVKKNQLRWDESLSQSTNQELTLAVKKRGAMPASPFHKTEDGLADFRGFPLKVQLARMAIEDVDFSRVTCFLAGSLNNCNVRRSKFSGANFDGRFFGVLFEDCDFEKASLKNTVLGSAYFLNCNFSGAKMSDAMARGATFTKCSFDRANMKKAVLLACTFNECTFDGTEFHNGSLVGCKFVGNRPGDAQLGNTMI
ncbi:pentapeptide repeat-containing protein [Burkholderia contaminans]|nr:pentapeptide repeat-containing protein [Burkholderia contaminans]